MSTRFHFVLIAIRWIRQTRPSLIMPPSFRWTLLIHVLEPPPVKSIGQKRGPTPSFEQLADWPCFGQPSPSRGKRKIGGVKHSKAKKGNQPPSIKGSVVGEWERLVNFGTKGSAVGEPFLKKNKTGSAKKMSYE